MVLPLHDHPLAGAQPALDDDAPVDLRAGHDLAPRHPAGVLDDADVFHAVAVALHRLQRHQQCLGPLLPQ
jgi:hypothetical protein